MTDDDNSFPYPRLNVDVRFSLFIFRRHGEALYRDGKLVRLGSRARSILALLIRNAGNVVSKREIMDSVWPETTVVEANLTVHIAALRQALGESRDNVQFIVNLPGRGYRFIGEVEPIGSETPFPFRSETQNGTTDNLPARLVAPIGREEAISRIAGRMDGSRLLTITGPAGVGKTTAALATAEQRTPRYRHGVWFVNLVPADDLLGVVNAIASVMRLELPSSDQLSALIGLPDGQRATARPR
jgi:DNA-binding winged helix-turn-helix (wHTH) protein